MMMMDASRLSMKPTFPALAYTVFTLSVAAALTIRGISIV